MSSLHDFAEREGLGDAPCGSVSQPETLHGVGQVTQVERGEPLKCLGEGGVRMEDGGEQEAAEGAEEDVIPSISSSASV